MGSRDEKAQRYIAQLDDARLNAKWAELPELIRKITKHAPQRTCLIRTATLEHEIVTSLFKTAAGPSATNSSSAAVYAKLVEVEKEAQTAKESSNDAIQAKAAVLWAYWADLELKGPPQSFLGSAGNVATVSSASIWTNVCTVKTAYITSKILQRKQQPENARKTLQSIVPWLDANRSVVTLHPQLAYWTEQIFADLATEQVGDTFRKHSQSTTALDFRNWAVLANKTTSSSAQKYGNPGPHKSRLLVWRLYYEQASDMVRQPAQAEDVGYRRELVTELRRVETAYENELLRNTTFPKATESNKMIDRWIQDVTSNWDIICGSDWTENDIGEGGRNLFTRNVLDVLYRAATKTFHSTLILRRLFQAHKALAEFDLAYRALDSYLELIDRGRARAKKSGESEDQDGDEMVLLTIAEGIVGLCSFGRSEEAERAEALTQKLDSLLAEVCPSAAVLEEPPIEVNGVNDDDKLHCKLSPEIIETIHRALGIGKAHWARWSPFNEQRSTLQSKAVLHFRVAARQPLSISQKRSSLFALSLLLAQTRDIDGAIDSVKLALGESDDPIGRNYVMSRTLLPLWHLLSLLLSARQDFDTANQACLAAFEQFPSVDVLFGSIRGRHTETEKHSLLTGLVEDMEGDEKERILELRLTELALADLTNGPEEAVNGSDDLLALYSRMFGRLGLATDISTSEKTLDIPKTPAGTIKSSKGSMFRRSRLLPSETATEEAKEPTPSIITGSSRPITGATQAPTIHVTDEDAKPTHKHRLFRHSQERGPKGRTSSESHGTLSSRLRSSSKDKKPQPVPSTVPSSRQSFETGHEGPTSSTGTAETARPHLDTVYSAEEVPQQYPLTSAEHNNEPSAKQTLPPVGHNLSSHDQIPPPAQHDGQPPEQDTRLPTASPLSTSTAPTPRFPHAASQKHALTVLVKLWLIIAQLYRRATMFEDSREATDEAAKAALKIEALVASTVESSSHAFADPGWGAGSKSSDDCWADVYCERGELLLAIAAARVHATASHELSSAHERDHGRREAVEMFEQCLMYKESHLRGGIALSSLLLDYYERKIDLTRRSDDDDTTLHKLGVTIFPPDTMFSSATASATTAQKRGQRELRRAETSLTAAINGSSATDTNTPRPTSSTSSGPPAALAEEDLKKTPENLNRLAARDRAYGLLSSLTKSGEGWDDSNAWFALARAYELGGEVERAKEILWWVVQLEDTRPLRVWSVVNPKGYVL